MKEIKEYDRYQDIPQKYRWKLDDILENKTFDEWLAEYEKLVRARIAIKDSKYDSIESYLEDVKLDEQATIIAFKLHNYSSNWRNTNVTDTQANTAVQKFTTLYSQLKSELGSEENRFFVHIDKMKQWKDDPRLKDYKRDMEDLIDSYEHKLSDDVENYLIQTSIGNPNPHNVFAILTNSELDFGVITTSKNKKIKLTPVNRSKLLKSNDEAVRKGAYKNYISAFAKHKNTLAELLYQHFKKQQVEAKVRKYNSTVEFLTHSDRVSDEILQKLYEQVSNRKSVFKKFNKYHKIFYKQRFKSTMHDWDATRDLVNVKTEYSVEEAKDLVTKALEPFGDEYINQIKKALSQNWVDFMSAKGKRSGAYSIGSSYGIEKKYILMNFNGTLKSVSTLAHELGHSMHSYYSDTRQSLNLSQYPIFLAEIASVFNELMLFDYLLKNSHDDKLKFTILTDVINGFIGTVMRQVEWSNYEYNLFAAIEDDQPVNNWSAISKLYFENSKKYSLKSNPKYNEEKTIASVYVPHFYYSFYVYKYAIGQLSANYFFAQYKKHGSAALQSYINNFLSAGSSDYPINILNKVGIDLTSESFYADGFTYVAELIDEWIKLGKKIFKVN